MKKSLSLAVTAFLFCLFVLPCFAAGTRPAVEVMWTDFDMNSVGGVSPQIWYRSNSDKPRGKQKVHKLVAANALIAFSEIHFCVFRPKQVNSICTLPLLSL